MSGALDNKETYHLHDDCKKKDKDWRRKIGETHRYDGTRYDDVSWI